MKINRDKARGDRARITHRNRDRDKGIRHRQEQMSVQYAVVADNYRSSVKN